MAQDDNRSKALNAALSQIERQFGKGTVMRLGDTPRVVMPSVSTGSLGLDIALGIGGLPYGRVVEIFGPESSGKTTLALHIAAEAQKTGGIVAFVDAEHALDIHYARKLGVRTDDLLVSQPDTGEQALEIAEVLVRSGAIDVLVVDSVAALVPRAEIEGEMGDSHMGLQARLMSQALRKLGANVSKANCVCIFINPDPADGDVLRAAARVRADLPRPPAGRQRQVRLRPDPGAVQHRREHAAHAARRVDRVQPRAAGRPHRAHPPQTLRSTTPIGVRRPSLATQRP